MMRRSIWQLTSCTSHGRICLQIANQIPPYLSSRRGFSAPPQSNVPEGPGSTPEAEELKSGSSFPKFFIGGVALGAATVLAYRTGYLDQFLTKEPRNTIEPIKVSPSEQDKHDLLGSEISQQGSEPNSDSNISASDVQHSGEDIVADSGPSLPEEVSSEPEKNANEVNEKSEHINPIQEDPSSPVTYQSEDTSNNKKKSPSDQDNLDLKKPEAVDLDQPKAVEITPSFHEESRAVSDSEKNSVSLASTPYSHKEDLGDASHQPSSLLGEYHLKNDGEEPPADSIRKAEDLHGINEGGYVSGDGKLVLDFLQAIHAAEERQAELDAQAYDKEKRAIKVKYEKELRDARARELMYAERESILEKELKREKVKAAAALKALEEELQEKHREDLENKVNEAELELKKVQELAKAELASAIASEKASQIEKMAEANMHINALCMAFYARSEEARQSHSVHKLALGALSLEDALSKGLPVQKEIQALRTCLEGTDNNSLLDIVLLSLPEETRTSGTDTLLQLNQKFDALKSTIRHFSLIPPGGGGILSHSLAHVASTLKVSEADKSGDGVESLMNKVDNFLAEGKLIEAADVLEKGLDGTQAAEVVGDWVKQARNRAITEQALTLLQSYATTISLT